MSSTVGFVAGVFGLLLVGAAASDASAQPAGAGPGAQPVGPTPYPAPYPNPYPLPPPGQAPYYPPQAYLPPPVLTADEQELLAEGEISTGQVVGGFALSAWMGLGLGQAVQGRWSDTGWIFTVGEPATITVAMVTLLGCSVEGCTRGQEAIGIASIFGYVGLRVWSLVDVVTGPSEHNRRLRNLKMRLGDMPAYARVRPYLLPAQVGSGATAGLTLQF